MKELFDSTRLKNLEMKNRFVRSATWEGLADEKGHMTPELFKVYEDLAKGGVGLIITSYAFVMEDEQPSPGMMGIYNESFIEEYRKLTHMVHSHGARIMMQIVYGGSKTTYRTDERKVWGMSAVKHEETGVTPVEMTKDDIDKLKDAFASAAARVKDAGFDGVQIHGAHGYLLSQSLSPFYNRREDEYGGNIEDRARLMLEVYEAVREKVGEDYAVMTKINCSDFDENGATFKECEYVCSELAKRGIDAIEVSGGGNIWRRSMQDEAIFWEYAAELAAELSCAVMLVGLNRSFENMTRLLNETHIRYFSMSRPFIREPELVNRWMSGDTSKPKCINCGKCMNVKGKLCIFN